MRWDFGSQEIQAEMFRNSRFWAQRETPLENFTHLKDVTSKDVTIRGVTSKYVTSKYVRRQHFYRLTDSNFCLDMPGLMTDTELLGFSVEHSAVHPQQRTFLRDWARLLTYSYITA